MFVNNVLKICTPYCIFIMMNLINYMGETNYNGVRLDYLFTRSANTSLQTLTDSSELIPNIFFQIWGRNCSMNAMSMASLTASR
jgi:hypothetical protein